MKCAKCGAELKLGCIYCSVCGQEAQIVSDSSLLEEELLRELLKEEKKPAAKPLEEKKRPKKKKSHKPLIISLSCLCALILIAAFLIAAIQNKNHNSYDYQVQRAETYVSEKNYVKALETYERALDLKEDDLEIRFAMVDVYLDMEEEKSAISLLHEIISMDAGNVKAYEQLIGLYESAGDYDAILKLRENAVGDEVQDLFADYEAASPEFSLEPGTYADYITVALLGEADCSIYYTLDGTDPVENGRLYEEPFSLEEQGELKIKAVSCNKYGIYSDVAEGKFTVEFKKPQMARAVPDSGTFTEPASIELTGPEGCHIYYTWDGSDPTVNSAEYTGPISVPEGNNILSVILVDKYGMISDVLKCNYRYLP